MSLDDVIKKRLIEQKINKKKENHLIKALFITFIVLYIILSTGVISYQYFKIQDLEQANIKQENKQDKKNNYFTAKYKQYENLLNDYKIENRRLIHAYRSAKNNNYNTPVKHKYIKPKINTISRTYTQPNTNAYTQPKTTYKPIKIYQHYSNRIKLISDSRITRKSDNRLESNSGIRGRYFNHEEHNFNCKRKENIPNVIDECSMNLSLINDVVYFRKSNLNSIKKYNKKTHMLECEYSKEHGIFHDCSVKIYKFL
jgi:hypothetical protein